MNNYPGCQGHKRKFMVGGLTWLCLSLVFSGCWSAKEDAARLAEIQSVWARLPSYPGMQETSTSSNSGGGKAQVSKKYNSDARYEDVKRFYVEYLERDGWKIVGEKQLKDWGSDFGGYEISFRKGDLDLAIEYAGPRADYGWKYAIGVSWSRWQTGRPS